MAAGLRIGGGETGTFQDYLDRLIKLIPGEVVGLSLVGVGTIPAGQNVGSAAWAGVCFLAVILVRALAALSVDFWRSLFLQRRLERPCRFACGASEPALWSSERAYRR